ncbi:MAG TPA: type I glyceraldehyde-3-phosphate dehydrogenase [Burkholderiales bacterium]|nr:type I glyceraldehyde-3-phosphate dehydrogenase [Burkholderiales bacterium]
MTTRIAITGYGRIGRNILRALYETHESHDLEIVAINAMGDNKVNAHLTQFDTVHGRFSESVSYTEKHLVINGKNIPIYHERDPEKLPWAELDVDIVLECTGAFTSKEKALAHIRAGAKKVLISAPGGNDVDATIVYGVNHNVITGQERVVSNASCTTNCLAPIAKVIEDHLGIESGFMTTIHAYTNDQVLTDVYHKDLLRARAATHSMIPTKTGAASAVGLVLPQLKGRLDGFAVRVPIINVSIVDLTVNTRRKTNVEEIHSLMKEASEGAMRGILDYSTLPLVSIDFNHTSASSCYDANLTRVIDGKLVKVCAWYDNEWGFCCRMIDTASYMMKLGLTQSRAT